MKRLLMLLIATLVIGSAFSGPVHINGPGLNTGVSIEIALSESFGLADVTTFPVEQAVSNLGQAGAFDVDGTAAVDLQGFYNSECLGVSGLLSMVSATAVASPDSQNFVFGDIARSQEVFSLRGCSKPACTKNKVIV